MSNIGLCVEKLKGQKGLLLIIAIALLGILILTLSPKSDVSDKTDEISETAYVDSVKTELEMQVTELINQMEGMSGVSVMLTLDCSKETVYARNGSDNGSTQYVVIDGKNGDVCVQVKTVEPKLRGAAVICSRGNEAEVQLRIISMLSALFGLSSNRIYVSG